MAGGAASVLRSNPEQHSNKSAAISKLLSSTYSRNAPNFVLASHSEALLHGLNALRCADKLFDVTLIVEGKTFKVCVIIIF